MKKIQLKTNKPVYLALSVLEISKPLKYEFCMIILNQSISTMQNFTTWILIVLLIILKLKMFMKVLQMMLKRI